MRFASNCITVISSVPTGLFSFPIMEFALFGSFAAAFLGFFSFFSEPFLGLLLPFIFSAKRSASEEDMELLTVFTSMPSSDRISSVSFLGISYFSISSFTLIFIYLPPK